MSMILTDLGNVTFYTFPDDFDLHEWSDRDFSARSEQIEKFGRHGASEVSDRAITPRRVKVTGAHHAASQAALKTFLDDLNEALHYNGEPYRFSWESGYYINASHVRTFRMKRYKQGLAYRSADIEIEFECPDPFWYSTTQDGVGPTSIVTAVQDITFTNNGNVPSPLIIQCDPTAAWADFYISNVTDAEDLMRYTDPGFGSGDQLIIDGVEGTVERDGANTIRYFRGSFLRVLPGSNTIRYSGSTGGTITLSAPKRFL